MKKGVQSHEELIVWQLSYQLKIGVYELIEASSIRTDRNLHDQLRNAARAAPRLMAEGFGRYLPGEFARYLRNANGELKETFDALRDAVDCGYVETGSDRPTATAFETRVEGCEQSHQVPAKRSTSE